MNIKDDKSMELSNAIRGFYNSNPAALEYFQFTFTRLVNTCGFNTLEDYSEDNLNTILEAVSDVKRSQNIVVNFYKYLFEQNIVRPKKLSLGLLKYKDFLAKLQKGYAIGIYNPYINYFSEDKWVLEDPNYIGKNIEKNVMAFDFSKIKNPFIRDQMKFYVWYYPSDLSAKKRNFYTIMKFLKILDDNNDVDKEQIEVSLKDINQLKLSIADKNSTSKAVYLNTVKNYLKFIESEKFITIKKGLYDFFSSKDVKSDGDTRAYSLDQILQIIDYIRNSSNFISDKLYAYMAELQYQTALRPKSIYNIRMKDIVLLSDNMYGLNIISKKETKPVNITKETKQLIEEINNLTLPFRNNLNEQYSDYIFAYEGNKRKILTLPTTQIYSQKINLACQALGLPEFGQTGIRNYYQQKVTEMVITEGLSNAYLTELSNHSISVHARNYDNYNRANLNTKLYNQYYNVEIGDIKVTGRIEDTLKYKASQIVEGGLGACVNDHCDNATNMRCLKCKNFATSPEELQLFETAIKELDELIYNEPIEHEKEDLMTRKADCVAYVKELEKYKYGNDK